MELIIDLLWFCSYLALDLALFYTFFAWHFTYFAEQGIPGPRPIPFFGNCWKIWSLSWPRLEVERYQKYGKIYGTFEGRTPNLVIADPKLIQKILVQNFDNFENRRKGNANFELKFLLNSLRGEKWRAVRSATVDLYAPQNVEKIIKLIEPSSQELVSFLHQKIASGSKKVDLRKIATMYAIDVVANCAFGTKLGAFSNPESEFSREITAIFEQDKSNSLKFIISQIYPRIGKLMPRPNGFQFFANYARNVLKMRRQVSSTASKRGDFLDMLLASAEENSALSDSVIVAQMLQFLIAGVQPVAITIACGLNSLAVNSDVQKELRAEIQTLTTDDFEGEVQKLAFLDQCLDETLRLFPPAIRLERRCNRSIAYAGAKIRKGMLVSVPVYAIHHDPEIYPQPYVFDPKRFSKELKNQRHSNTFLPFGEGQRSCVASTFARSQIKIALAHLIRNFSFHRVFETSDPPNFAPGGFPPTLNPETVIVGIEKC